jgi:serine/threonine protein kinase
LAEVLQQGDIVAPGALLQGEPIHLLSIPSAFGPSFSATTAEDTAQDSGPVRELEVVRRLGTGSYAVVYLVRELLDRPSSDGDNSSEEGLLGPIDLDAPLADIEHPGSKTASRYGKEYAIKCLSKANLDEDALYSQLSEVCGHIYHIFFAYAYNSLTLIIPGLNPPESQGTPQYRDTSPNDGNRLFPAPLARICPRPGFVLFP